MDDLGQGATSVPAAPQDLHAGRTVMAEGLSDLPKGKTGHALPMTASSAGMFATTLRSRRARQKSALPLCDGCRVSWWDAVEQTR